MADIQRQVKESPLAQGANERVAYTLTTTPWGGSPTSPTVTVLYDGTDVTGTKATGSATVAGDVITTPVIHSLETGKRYTVLIKWVKSGNTEEAVLLLDGD